MKSLTVKVAVKGYENGELIRYLSKDTIQLAPGERGLAKVFSTAADHLAELESEADSLVSASVSVHNDSGKQIASFAFDSSDLLQGVESDPLVLKPKVALQSFELPTFSEEQPPVKAEAPVSNPILEYVEKKASTNESIEFNHEKVMGVDGSGKNAVRMMSPASDKMIEAHLNRGDVIRFEMNHKIDFSGSEVKPFNHGEIERSYFLVSQPAIIAPKYLMDGMTGSEELTEEKFADFLMKCDTWRVHES